MAVGENYFREYTMLYITVNSFWSTRKFFLLVSGPLKVKKNH